MRATIKSVAATAAFFAVATMSAGSLAAEAKKSSVDTFSTNVYTQALVDRMDANKDGKVSKAEFMKFVEAEWNALDKNKDGVLQTTEFANREYFQRSQEGAKD
jgi:Ca2+-binding EF-hand superfamily protein